MRKNDIEKSLKRFLKRKVSYSLSLLIAFMITGGISLGAGITAEEIQETKSDLLTRIQTEREEIKRKIAENERLIKEYNSDFVELVRKGDFYSKPLFNSTQIFFTYQYLDNGKMKDRTDKEFAETIDAINKHYGTRSGRSLLRSSGNIGKDKIMSGNGVAVDTEVFRETIEVGANIKPIEPELPVINPSVSVSVSAPTVSLGTLPGTVSPTMPTMPTITVPVVSVPTPPNGVSVSVATPAAVDKITVTAPTITTPTTPSDKVITVKTPTAPGGYDPTMIIPPVTPETPVVTPISLSIPTLSTVSYGNGDGSWFWNTGGSNGIISQVIMTSGNWNIVMAGTGTTATDAIDSEIKNYTAKFPATYTATSITDQTYSGTNIGGGKAGIYRIVGSPYSSFGTATKVVINAANRTGSNLRQFIHIDPHGDKAQPLADIADISASEKSEAATILGAYTSTNVTQEANTQVLALNGEISVTGNLMNLVGAQGHSNNGRNVLLLNTGKIKINGDKNIVFAYTPSGDGANRYYITSNYGAGSIVIENGTSNFIMFMDRDTGYKHILSFKNNAHMEIKGGTSNVGVFLKKSTFDGTIDLIKPIILSGGTKNIAVYQVNESRNSMNVRSVLKADITGGDKNVGFYGEMAQTIASHEFNLGGTSENGVGVYSGANLVLGTGNINLTGGTGNIGLFAKGGNITTNGNISLTGGTGNMIAFSDSGKLITINGNVKVGNIASNLAISNTIPLYVTGANSKIEIANDKLEMNLTGDSIGVYSTTNGEFTANRTSLAHSGTGFGGGIVEPTAPVNIYVKGTTVSGVVKGVGLFVNNGGKINTKNTYVKVKDGSVGVASTGNNSNIDITNGIIDYEGSGYAVYSDGTGKINLTSGEIILRGKATALELDLSGTNPITLTGSKIVVMSNDAVGVNLKNTGPLDISSLETDIGTALGGVSIVAGTDGSQVFDKYKIAAVDGGTLNINANMDKSDTNTSSAGFFYYRRFLGQRLELNVLNGVEVKSEINSSDASTYFKGQVVGLEMSSSNSATSATNAQINLAANSKVMADRTDAGAGAIGLYMNFGKIDIGAGAKVEVEKGANTVNDKGVGIYGVNGSTVTNAGDIEVSGKEAIGILGMAYREDSLRNPILDEFGTGGIFTAQGKVNITNSGSVTLDGTGSIGIYADNNNASGTKTGVLVTNTNTGVVTVGASDGSNAAIGIYGKKATISNLGKVSVGDGGVAIYATEGSEITNLGTLDLGADGVGVMADGTSDITATTVTLTSNNTGTLGKTGIFYKGTGSENKSINIAIDASSLTKGTAIYAENMNITSSGTLGIGQEGVGIFVKGTSANTGTNSGTINLTSGKTGAVGIYTKTANILNNTGGIINVNDSSQIGIYTEGTGNRAINKGTINLNVDGATGIYVKSGAITELDTGNTITFSGKSSVGVFAESAQVNFKNNLTLTNNNENKNIFVYGKGATVGIDSGKIVTVDGIGTPTTPGNKTVGIYLENAGTGSTFNGAAGQLIVQREAVGIYSKGNNTLNVHVTATGEKTTGVFIDGASTITGTVTAQGTSTAGAVGVYGSGGAVTIGAGGLTLNTNLDKGTGMYLTDGASATGGAITVNNTAGVKNIGVYYSKGTSSGTVTNSSAISLAGSDSIGIYAADGITLVNNTNITSAAGQSDSIASYVGGGSQLTSAGTITLNDAAKGIGIYTEEGKGINSGTITLNGTAGSMVGMVSEAKSGKTASVENTNTITAGNNLGMYIAGAGTSSGKNTGNITATGTGTGVYVNGSGNSFNGTGGSITSNAVGIYLEDTDTNKITAGTLNIASGGVGVFGKNAKIDFAVNVTGTGAVGVAAKSGSVISGNVTTGQDSVGVYLLDDTVTFNGANIVTGTNNSGTSVGVLFDAAITSTYTMNNVSVNAKNGVGIYLGGAGMNLNHNGTVTTENGIGIYVPTGTTLATGTSVMNVNGGTGVYIHGGTANLGTSGNLTFNFLAGGGIGVFNNGGTLNLGNNITVTGSGSLAATSNGSLNSTGNLNIGEGATGMLGTYDSAVTGVQSITNNGGTITAASGGIGLAAVKGTTNPGFAITIRNSGTINANGVSSTNTPSIGIFTDVADVINTGIINVGSNGIGIYSNHNGVLTSVQNDNMTMSGTDGIGIYLKGATVGLTSNNINSTGLRNTGVVLEGVTTNINIGTINLGNESIGVLATTGTTSALNGAVTVGNSSAGKSAIGVVANGGSNITIAGSSIITAGNGGIGVYAEGAGTIVTVSNTGNITVGTDGIYMYSKDATLNFTGNITANNQIGIVADGGTINAMGASTITVQNGGIGAYVKNAAPAFGTTTIAVQAGTSSEYSMGVYYDGVSSIGTAPTITQTGSYTIGMVLNNSIGTTAGGISIGGAGITNQVGVMAKGNSNLTVAGTVTVSGGNNNIGVYGENSIITANNNITVAAPSSSDPLDPMKYSSIGIYMNKGSYIGTGNVSVGNNSIGIYGKDLNGGSISQTGTVMTVGNSGVGIYGTGTGNGTENINLTMTTGITLGNNNSIGVYAKNINSSVTGDMYVGTNTSIGIVSEGNGNVTYSGDLTIEDKGIGVNDTGSVGIYKLDGTGTVNVLAGNWNVGNNGYGIFLKQAAEQSATINNNADMTLETAAVGIFSSGKNIVNNIGDITVGKTDVNGDHNNTQGHLNSVGMYISGGTVATSSGIITVNHDHSVGVYGEGAGTRFTNTGTINVDNGGVGILVRNGAVAVNAVGGNINLGGTLASCGAVTIGMASHGAGATIINNGTITVNQGAGMLVGTGTIFENNGTIIVNNGVGIEGIGSTINAGHIVVNGGIAVGSGGLSTANVGAVEIKPDGTIKINGNYTSIGGTLTTAGAIIVDGAYVDVTTGTPLFNANSVSGEVKILSNFATTGNGRTYEIEGFVNTAMGTITGTKLTPVVSPLYVAKVTDKGSLVIAKRDYNDMTLGKQFEEQYKGLDNIFKDSDGEGRDGEILKSLNKYLNDTYLNDPSGADFEREMSRTLAETRGDIYATIQGRMQDINRAFDNSFYELESSYNMTKDSSKYSVIYTDGNYKDSTLGIDDYDYKVMGLLYMKEKEGTEYGSKYGYTVGFAGSKFDFDDGGSKEDVYSLRVGAHRIKNLSEEHKVSWLSRIELGYNRHIAKRKLELDKTYENKGEYNTYSVAFDNRLTKVIYTDLSRQLDVYADLDLEYGKIDDFKESAGSKGGLEVQIKDNDYLSAQVGAGVKASQRIYAVNDISVKVTADVKYAYEFGDNYDGNKAKLKNGREGYYSLITPEEREGKLTGKIGLTVEKANHMGVTFEVEAADEGHKKDSSIKYGVRFNYKF